MSGLVFLILIACVPTVRAVIDASSESSCHTQNGRWVTVTMKDSSIPADGWEGNYLHFQNDELEDLYSFTLASGLSSDTETFCLDHTGDQFSKCYTIYMDDEGYNPQQISWTVKITTRNSGASWRTADGIDQWVSGETNNGHGWNPNTGVMEAIKEGGSPADVKVLCGRLFKKLGRYSMKQIDKVGIDQMSNEDNMFYKSQSALEKIEERAQQLNLYSSADGEPNAIDKDDWFSGDSESTTTASETTVDSSVTTTTTLPDDCDKCGNGCTGCAVKSWRGDGQCDDDNNSCGCGWDGGDCCGSTRQTLYCTDCVCQDPDYDSRRLRG